MPETQTAANKSEPKAPVNVGALLDEELAAQPDKPAAEAAPSVSPQPAWKDAVFEGDEVPDYIRGKKGVDALKYIEGNEAARRHLQGERDRLARENENYRIQQAAAQAVQQLQQRQAEPQPPQDDPRWAQVDELHMSGSYEESGRLRRQLVQEEARKLAQEETAKVKREITQEALQQRNRDMGTWAHNQALSAIRARGVPEHLIDRKRIAALYSAITLPSTQDSPNPYYDSGGPMNPSVIEAAWGELYGFPQQQMQEVPPAPAPPQLITSPPPGARKPSPAAGPTPERAAPMRREVQDLYAAVAEEKGWDTNEFVERGRKRQGVA